MGCEMDKIKVLLVVCVLILTFFSYLLFFYGYYYPDNELYHAETFVNLVYLDDDALNAIHNLNNSTFEKVGLVEYFDRECPDIMNKANRYYLRAFELVKSEDHQLSIQLGDDFLKGKGVPFFMRKKYQNENLIHVKVEPVPNGTSFREKGKGKGKRVT